MEELSSYLPVTITLITTATFSFRFCAVPKNVNVRPEAPPSELAVAVARHFEGMEVDEEECIGGFLERLEKGTGPTAYSRKTTYFDGRAPHSAVRKRKRTKLAARPGEQV